MTVVLIRVDYTCLIQAFQCSYPNQHVATTPNSHHNHHHHHLMWPTNTRVSFLPSLPDTFWLLKRWQPSPPFPFTHRVRHSAHCESTTTAYKCNPPACDLIPQQKQWVPITVNTPFPEFGAADTIELFRCLSAHPLPQTWPSASKCLQTWKRTMLLYMPKIKFVRKLHTFTLPHMFTRHIAEIQKHFTVIFLSIRVFFPAFSENNPCNAPFCFLLQKNRTWNIHAVFCTGQIIHTGSKRRQKWKKYNISVKQVQQQYSAVLYNQILADTITDKPIWLLLQQTGSLHWSVCVRYETAHQQITFSTSLQGTTTFAHLTFEVTKLAWTCWLKKAFLAWQ